MPDKERTSVAQETDARGAADRCVKTRSAYATGKAGRQVFLRIAAGLAVWSLAAGPPLRSRIPVLLEDFGRESLDLCSLLPGIERQSSFSARLLQERDAVPVMLDRNLR